MQAIILLLQLLCAQQSFSLYQVETEDGHTALVGEYLNPAVLADGVKLKPVGSKGKSDQHKTTHNKKHRVMVNLAVRWEGGRVPYELGSLTAKGHEAVLAAIADLRNFTCIQLVPRTTETDYLQFVDEDGCWSMVGRQGGMQKVSIGEGCEDKGRALHEILHALGWEHEQCRIDRDKYVKVLWENIAKGEEPQFTMADGSDDPNDLAETLTPYCYGSIMHYPVDSFTADGNPTLKIKTRLPKGFEVGAFLGLNECDVIRISQHYKCEGKQSKTPLIKHQCRPRNNHGIAYFDGEKIVERKFVRKCSARVDGWSFHYVGCVGDNETEVQLGEKLIYRDRKSICTLDEKGQIQIEPLNKTNKILAQCKTKDGKKVRVNKSWQDDNVFWKCQLRDGQVTAKFVGCADHEGNPRQNNEEWAEYQNPEKPIYGIRRRCFYDEETGEASIKSILCLYREETIEPGCYRQFDPEHSGTGNRLYVDCVPQKEHLYVNSIRHFHKRPEQTREDCSADGRVKI